MSTTKSLKQLKKAELLELIEHIYGVDEKVDEIVNHYISSSKKPYHPLNLSIKQQVKRICSESDTIDSDATPYAIQLNDLLKQICVDLRGYNLQLSLHATEDFLWLSNNIYQRLEDTSNTEIGKVFRKAIEHWLDIASELRSLKPKAENWIEKILGFFDNNDYGVFDDIVRHSHKLLTSDELKRLAWRFNSSAKRALSRLPNRNSYCSEAAQACFGLRSVAEAMQDIDLFEKSYLLSSPTPNVLQMESIVRFALSVNNYERAKYWLDRPQWQTNYNRYKSLRNQLLQTRGNMRELMATLAEDFRLNPCDNTLAPLWDLSNSTQKQSLYKKISQLAKQTEAPKDTIDMLFRIGNYELADEILVLHWQEFSDKRYGKLPYWAEQIDENVHPLACILRD